MIGDNDDTFIESYNRQQGAVEDALQPQISKAAEHREAVFASMVLAAGLLMTILQLVNVRIPFDDVIILSSVVYGTITVPRLERVNEVIRLIMMTFLTGMVLIYTRTILPQKWTMVTVASLVLLFASSIINSTASAQGLTPAIVERHGKYLGWFLGIALLLSLLFA